MTKSLPTGPIRFGVAPRRPIEAIDDDPSLSTGPDGSFQRRRQESFFYADSRYVLSSPSTLPQSHHTTTLIEDVLTLPKPLLALVPFGALFVLLGLAVLVSKGAAGWIEVLFGLAMIAVPIVITAQQRRATREREEHERAVREEREKRNRELLGTYVAALEKLRDNPTRETMDAVARERAAIDLPDSVWAPPARLAVLSIGFQALHRLGPSQAREVGKLMADAAASAGLHAEDKRRLNEDLYHTILWHLLADDRDGNAQAATMEQLRKGLDVEENEPAAEEFRRLRGIGVRNLPRAECNIKLGFHEYCIHGTKGLFITNKRVLFPSQKPAEVALPKIDDVEVDADTNVMKVRVAGLKKPLQLTLPDPIYTASLIDIASSLNERPRGFA